MQPLFENLIMSYPKRRRPIFKKNSVSEVRDLIFDEHLEKSTCESCQVVKYFTVISRVPTGHGILKRLFQTLKIREYIFYFHGLSFFGGGIYATFHLSKLNGDNKLCIYFIFFKL